MKWIIMMIITVLVVIVTITTDTHIYRCVDTDWAQGLLKASACGGWKSVTLPRNSQQQQLLLLVWSSEKWHVHLLAINVKW